MIEYPQGYKPVIEDWNRILRRLQSLEKTCHEQWIICILLTVAVVLNAIFDVGWL